MQPSRQPTSHPPHHFPTPAPSPNPSPVPTRTPNLDPTGQPSGQPSHKPSGQPSRYPSSQPSTYPSGRPTGQPTGHPSWWAPPTGRPTAEVLLESVNGTVTFLPATTKVCQDAAFVIVFTTSFFIPTSVTHLIYAPGMTNTGCSMISNATQSSKQPVRLQTGNPRDFSVSWVQGSFRNGYMASHFVLRAKYDLPAGTYSIHIDRSNHLQRTCPTNSTWSVVRAPPEGTNRLAKTTGYLEFSHYLPGDCFAYNTSLSFFPPHQSQEISVNLSLTLGFDINVGDSITLYLPGFTNRRRAINASLHQLYLSSSGSNPIPVKGWGAYDAIKGDDSLLFLGGVPTQLPTAAPTTKSPTLSPTSPTPATPTANPTPNPTLAPTAPSANPTVRPTFGNGAPTPAPTSSPTYPGDVTDWPGWTGYWHEGNLTLSLDQSKATLFPNKRFPAGVPFWVLIDRYPNHLSSKCGRVANYSGFRISITSPSSGYTLNLTSVQTSTVIGDGCQSLNYCSGNGNCDYCTDRCKCFNGYGSSSDLLSAVSNDFSPDCSSRTCPRAPAIWTNTIDFASGPPGGFNRLVECSNNGLCQRSTGTCQCFAGYEGSACEKMSCPVGSFGEVCSGRGSCKAMTWLAVDQYAQPLTHWSHNYDLAYRRGNVQQLNISSPLSKPGEGNFGHACVCDSGWPVGLGANQTQLAEYFGVACEFRRCPSGDDPETPNVNERNCTGKSQTGGLDRGSLNNLCHVDCSNQGICDFNSGVCSCFPGFHGANCGQRIFEGTGTVYRPSQHWESSEQSYSRGATRVSLHV